MKIKSRYSISNINSSSGFTYNLLNLTSSGFTFSPYIMSSTGFTYEDYRNRDRRLLKEERIKKINKLNKNVKYKK